jgi:N-acetylglucosamine kinase-like BadF-type ATPase
MKGPPDRLFLAIDGGILETDCILLTPDGDVLAHVRTGETSPQRIGVPATVAAIDQMRSIAFEQAGLDPSAAVARIGAFLAGVDLPAERQELQAAMALRFPATELIVENDIHAVLWAGMRRPSGVAVICGGGINALARSATGKTAGYLALGTISGEWGGALSLGREVLFAASRAEDGRGPQTSLRYQVAAAFGRATVRESVADLHTGRARESALAELVSVLFRADKNGDPIATALVDRLAEEIVTMAKTAMDRAFVPPTGSDVVLAGSVLTVGHRRLDEMIDDGFARALPGAAVRRLALPTVVGAALACIGADRGGPASNDRYTRLITDSLASLDGKAPTLVPPGARPAAAS